MVTAKTTKRSAIAAELRTIAEANNGVLTAENVVKFARNSKTALHSQFTWDNSEAAHKYRLWQARQIISVSVTYEPRVERNVRAFVSLPSDRRLPAGGYRQTIRVMSDSQRRAELLESALAELAVFEKKWQHLKELAEVFEAARRVRSSSTKVKAAAK